MLGVLRIVAASRPAGVGGLREVQALDAIEHVPEVLVDFEGPVAVRQDVQQSLVRHEVEPRECLLLLFEILVQSPLASVDALADGLQHGFAALGTAGLHDEGGARGIHHEVLPGRVHHLEPLGIVGKLRPDVVGLHEDGLQAAPIGLDLLPDAERSIDGPELAAPLVHQRLAELDEAALRRHAHHLQGVAIEALEDLAELAEQGAIRTRHVEGHRHLGPNVLDDLELLVDLRLLGRLVHDLRDLFRELVQRQVREVLEAKLGPFLEGLLGDGHELRPVAVAHGLSVEVVDEWQHGAHVFNLLLQPPVQSPRADRFRHVLDLGLDVARGEQQGLRVDLVPQDGVPAFEGGPHQDRAVPQIFQVDQLLGAFLELAVVGHLHVEEELQVVELVGTLAV
mmetsp:Transcript_168782/g.542462  ORF Transcript_168782/g.542462 Transcript_168782/m.542462 type:complete len:395 (+) Transcript_168782:882-2066(+)